MADSEGETKWFGQKKPEENDWVIWTSLYFFILAHPSNTGWDIFQHHAQLPLHFGGKLSGIFLFKITADFLKKKLPSNISI